MNHWDVNDQNTVFQGRLAMFTTANITSKRDVNVMKSMSIQSGRSKDIRPAFIYKAPVPKLHFHRDSCPWLLTWVFDIAFSIPTTPSNTTPTQHWYTHRNTCPSTHPNVTLHYIAVFYCLVLCSWIRRSSDEVNTYHVCQGLSVA